VEGGGLLRVTVVAADRRADLGLPVHVPVAELLPELARTLNLLDPQTVFAGYVLVTSDGRRLRGEIGLAAQGVENGSVLTMTAGADARPPRVYDDVVEAMADTVEEQLQPWDPAVGRRTALAAATLVLAVGALSLGLLRVDVVAAAVAGVSAAVLVAAGIVLARSRGEHETAVLLCWAGVVYAATAGLTGMPGDPLGLPLVVAAAAAAVAALLGVLGLPERRAALLPGVVTGGLGALAAGIAVATHSDPAGAALVLLLVVVLAGSLLPWLSLASAGGVAAPAAETADPGTAVAQSVPPVDPTTVARTARRAHELLLAVIATVGLVVVLVAPLAVSLGVYGAVVAVAASVVLLLRTRQYRVGSEVAAGLVAGVAGLTSTCVSIVLLQRSWLPALAVALALVAVVLLVSTLVPMPRSVRRGRLGDVAELTALVAMVPLVVLATGLVGAVAS
jgi:type VII secretion integral membrane protein EccD